MHDHELVYDFDNSPDTAFRTVDIVYKNRARPLRDNWSKRDCRFGSTAFRRLETCAKLACSSDKLVLLNSLPETGHFDTDINHPNIKGTRKKFITRT